ncbi:embryo-specific protein ATS3A-like [Cornus florida]|uniref:embryo-specific protein ATS3A-like n=1 Tax=Cornus florida TaxID=4283 RepID=UPI002897D44C|nr:embryo-specific protein ATS3A-like [Cornus florida]
MKNSSHLTISVIAIIIFSTANGSQITSIALQGNRSYSIQIETTCAPAAETTDTISLRFSDSAGDLVIIKHLKNPKLLYAPKGGSRRHGGAYGGFARCAVEMFEVSGARMGGRVCALYLKRFGSDGWRPGWVKVLRRQDNGREVPVSYMFYFRTFVPGNVWYGFDYCQSRGGFVPHVATFGS